MVVELRRDAGVTWTAIVLAGVVATLIVAIINDAPAPLEDDETNWP
jgi:hypothetical protein